MTDNPSGQGACAARSAQPLGLMMRSLILLVAVGIPPLAWSQTVVLTEDNTQYATERGIARQAFADDIKAADELGAASGPLVPCFGADGQPAQLRR